MDVHITTLHFAFLIDKRFVHFVQHSSEVIAPVEVAGWGRYRLDAHYRQPRRVGLQSRERLRSEELLDPRAQRRLAHSGWSEDENNRVRGALSNGGEKPFLGIDQTRMSDREILEVPQSGRPRRSQQRRWKFGWRCHQNSP